MPSLVLLRLLLGTFVIGTKFGEHERQLTALPGKHLFERSESHVHAPADGTGRNLSREFQLVGE